MALDGTTSTSSSGDDGGTTESSVVSAQWEVEPASLNEALAVLQKKHRQKTRMVHLELCFEMFITMLNCVLVRVLVFVALC
jgi:hypothetical protein